MKKERLNLTEHEALTEWASGGFDYIETDILEKLQEQLQREIERRRAEASA